MSERRLTYTFGPLERRGLLGPVGGGQVAMLATGALLAVVILDRSPSPTGALAAIATCAGAILASVVRLGRRDLSEWAPVASAYLVRRVAGRTSFRSPAPETGSITRGGEMVPPAPAAPAELRGVRIESVPHGRRGIGAIAEHAGRRMTAVLACRVAAFSLLDPEAQERRLARWGELLAGAAAGPIRRLQWVERTVPAQGDELARWLHAERDPSLPPRGTAMVESYLELIGSTTQVTREHEILLAVQIDLRSGRGRSLTAGQSLVEATERIAKGLEAGEVIVLGALTAGQLSRTLRTAFDPYARAELAGLEAAAPRRDGLASHAAWPLAAEERWDHYRTDGALHATYWIGGWPRIEVSPMFMNALLGRSSAVRSVSVTFEPLSPERSRREIEAAITRDHADRELRVRFGQSETARQRQARDAAVRREAELAAGHGEVRLSGFITVSGRDETDLRRSCAEVLDHAARAHLELHRLYGQQADAFTFTLPLCRGLR